MLELSIKIELISAMDTSKTTIYEAHDRLALATEHTATEEFRRDVCPFAEGQLAVVIGGDLRENAPNIY